MGLRSLRSLRPGKLVILSLLCASFRGLVVLENIYRDDGLASTANRKKIQFYEGVICFLSTTQIYLIPVAKEPSFEEWGGLNNPS